MTPVALPLVAHTRPLLVARWAAFAAFVLALAFSSFVTASGRCACRADRAPASAASR